MKLITRTAVAAAALVAPLSMASAAVLLPGTQGVSFDVFDLSTQGSQLAANKITGCSGPTNTFCGTMSVAVYQNTLGTLDFYYQFTRASGTDPVEKLTGAYFAGYSTFAYYSSVDADGAGSIFTTDTNVGAPATASRTINTGILGVNFDIGNPVTGSQSSATYIFRTDAKAYTTGLFGAIDGQTFSGAAYMPAAVPEPASWAMMVGGFGLLGGALRRKRSVAVSFG